MTTLPQSIFDDGSRLPRTNFRQRREVTPTGGGVGATRPIATPATVVEPKSDRSRRRAEDAALVTELLSDEIDFMDHPDFHKAGAERRIYHEAPPVPRPTVGWYRPMMDDIGTTSPRRHEGIVLTAAQERVIFMQFNYARFRMRKIQKALRGRVPNAEESKDPKRNVVRATMISVIGLGVGYVITAVAFESAFPKDQVVEAAQDPAGPFFVAMEAFGTPWLATIMQILILTGAFACAMAFHNVAMRYFYAMGREGILPSKLGSTHNKYKVPHVANITALVVALVIMLIWGTTPLASTLRWNTSA